LDTPLGSGLGLGSESMKGETYTVSVHFPTAVYAHLIQMAGDKDMSLDEMIVRVCKKGLDRCGGRLFYSSVQSD
jgi:hypothetical protein